MQGELSVLKIINLASGQAWIEFKIMSSTWAWIANTNKRENYATPLY